MDREHQKQVERMLDAIADELLKIGVDGVIMQICLAGEWVTFGCAAHGVPSVQARVHSTLEVMDAHGRDVYGATHARDEFTQYDEQGNQAYKIDLLASKKGETS